MSPTRNNCSLNSAVKKLERENCVSKVKADSHKKVNIVTIVNKPENQKPVTQLK